MTVSGDPRGVISSGRAMRAIRFVASARRSAKSSQGFVAEAGKAVVVEGSLLGVCLLGVRASAKIVVAMMIR